MNNKDNNQSQKKILEQYVLSQVLHYLGLSNDIVSQDEQDEDKPDGKLILEDGTKIGIEVTQYTATKNKEIKSILDDMLLEYANEHLPNITNNKYDITVAFHWDDYPQNIKLKQIKNDIFREIDSFLLDGERLSRTEFVAEATFYPINGDQNFASAVMAIVYGDVVEDYIQKSIHEKESKLIEYKKLPKNIDITEYWLAIYLAFEEKTEFSKYELPKDFESTYDRIYLVAPGDCKEIYKKLPL